MEFTAVIRLIRKWGWLLVLGAVLGGGTAYLLRSNEPDKYEANAILAVGTTLEIPNPDSSFITTAEDLARTYALLATTHDVLDAAIETGGYPLSVHQLREMISAHAITGTALLEINLTCTDPFLAADLTNEVARQLVNKSPSSLSNEQQSQLDLANAEIIRLDEELKQIREELKALDENSRNVTDPDEMRLIREQRYTWMSIADEKSRNIAEFTKIVAGFQQRTNSLTVVESAFPPSAPIGFTASMAGLAGGLLSVIATVGIVLLLEYFDDTIPSSTEAAQLLSLPVLATINRFGRLRDTYSRRLIAYREPDAPATEGYRALRTNLLYHSNGTSPLSGIIITSPSKGEGKSITAANLAVTMALAGLRVLLIDGDLRSPTLHRVFGLDNTNGLSNLMLGARLNEEQADGNSSNSLFELEPTVHETNIPGLRVITSGSPPFNPSEVLGSEVIRQWIYHFQSKSDTDILLIDTPPVLSVTDATALAASANLPILFVIHARKTRSNEAIMAKERLDVLGTRVLGIVFNGASPKEQYSYYRYGK